MKGPVCLKTSAQVFVVLFVLHNMKQILPDETKQRPAEVTLSILSGPILTNADAEAMLTGEPQ